MCGCGRLQRKFDARARAEEDLRARAHEKAMLQAQEEKMYAAAPLALVAMLLLLLPTRTASQEEKIRRSDSR